MFFRTEVLIPKPSFSIRPLQRMLFVGSCFADNIGRRFEEEKFRAVVNPYGVMYNPVSILHTVGRYVDENRKALLQRYKDFDTYAAQFEVPAELLDSIVAEGKRKKVEPKDEAELEETLADLRFIIKCSVAYDLWDRNEYFRLVNERNDLLQRALRYLKEDK